MNHEDLNQQLCEDQSGVVILHPSSDADEQVVYRRDIARSQWFARRDELGAMGDEPIEPGMPWLMAILSIAGVAFTLCLSFYDLIFVRFLARNQALAAGLFAGAVVAGPVVMGILGGARRHGAGGLVERLMWGVVGTGFGVGLVLMRLSTASGVADILLSCGLAFVELVILLAVELTAHSLAVGHRHWREEYSVFRAHEEQERVAWDRYALHQEELTGQLPAHPEEA